MKRWIVFLALSMSHGMSGLLTGAEKNTYPAPRFPSYTKVPKSVEEIMPYARSIAAQTTGLQGDGFGILKKGESAAKR
jgi:hypothetical protein